MGGLFSIPDDKRDISSTSNAKDLPQVNTDTNSLGVVHLLVDGKGETSKGGHWSLLFDFGNWSSYENVEDGNGSPLKSFVGVQVHLGLAQVEKTNTQFTTCLTTVRDKRSPLNLTENKNERVYRVGTIRNIGGFMTAADWAHDFCGAPASPAGGLDWARYIYLMRSTSESEEVRHFRRKAGLPEAGLISDKELAKLQRVAEEHNLRSHSASEAPLTDIPHGDAVLSSDELPRVELFDPLTLWDSKVNCHTFAKFVLARCGLFWEDLLAQHVELPDSAAGKYSDWLVDTVLALILFSQQHPTPGY